MNRARTGWTRLRSLALLLFGRRVVVPRVKPLSAKALAEAFVVLDGRVKVQGVMCLLAGMEETAIELLRTANLPADERVHAGGFLGACREAQERIADLTQRPGQESRGEP